MSEVVWKKFHSIEVSNTGLVKTERNPDGYIGTDNGHGYKVVSVIIDGKQKNLRVHRLIGFLFLGLDIENNKQQMNHKNHDKSDNRIENLEIVDQRENQQKLIKHKYGHLFGTTYRKDLKTNQWASQIIDKYHKRIHLGYYQTQELAHQEAVEAYAMEFKELPHCQCDFCKRLMSC